MYANFLNCVTSYGKLNYKTDSTKLSKTMWWIRWRYLNVNETNDSHWMNKRMNVTDNVTVVLASTCLAQKFQTFLPLVQCALCIARCRSTHMTFSIKMPFRQCSAVYGAGWLSVFAHSLVEPTFSQCTSVKPQALFYYIHITVLLHMHTHT